VSGVIRGYYESLDGKEKYGRLVDGYQAIKSKD
jgi:hypothetical protein